MKFMHQFGTQLTLFATGDLSIGATRNPFHLHTCEVAIRAVWLGTNRTEPPFSPYFNVPGSNRHEPARTVVADEPVTVPGSSIRKPPRTGTSNRANPR